MDRRRQTVGAEDNSEDIAQSTETQTDEDFIEQIKADEEAIDSEENEDGGEA